MAEALIATDSDTYDFDQIVADLNRLLRLRTTPIGLKLFERRPSPSIFHVSLGPPSPQLVSIPVCKLLLSRFGPRHCGQSWDPLEEGSKANVIATEVSPTNTKANTATSRGMVFSKSRRGGIEGFDGRERHQGEAAGSRMRREYRWVAKRLPTDVIEPF